MASFLSTIVGLMASAAVALPAKAAVDPNRYMFFATRARMPSGALVTAALGSNYVCSKIIVNTPQYDTNTFRFHYSGFALTEGGNSPQETVVTGVIGTPGNSTTIDLAFARINGVFYPLKFSAADSAVVVDQTNGIWCDPLVLPKAVRAKSAIEIWTFYHTAVGEKQYPVYRVQKHRGERVWGASDLASLLAFKDNPLAASTPALDANYGLQNQAQYYGPDFMVAKGAWDGRPVVLVPADSIGESRQEFGPAADARGNIGITRRWLDKGYSIPHCIIGVPGAAAFREYTGTGSSIATRRRDIIREIIAFNNGKLPFTTILNQLGFNDAATPYATYTSRYTGEVARLRAEYPGVKIVALVPTGRAGQRTVTLTSVGTLVTATIAETAHLKTGQTLTITNAVPAGYNGNFVIKVTSATTFTYEMPASQTSPATGTITASDWFMTEGNQAYSAPSVFPANAADANTGKWLLRNDIMSKASAFCDDYIDTLDAWQGSAGIGKWPRLDELPSTRLTVATGTDGVATYNQLVVEDGSIFIPEQPLVIFEPDQPRYLSTATVESVDGNTITIKNPIPKIMPVGSRVFQQVSVDGVHPWSAAIRRIVSRIPQSEKTKLVTSLVPESSLFFNRLAYLTSPPISEDAMVSTAPVTKTIIATTKGKYATGSRAATTQDSSITRQLIQIGPASMTELQLEVNNWWLLANSTEEQINSGTLSVEATLVDLITGNRARFKFSAADIGTAPVSGTARIKSDALLPSAFGLTLFPAYSEWLLVIRRTTAASTDGLPWHGTNQSLTRELEYEYQYASATSNAASIAAAYLDAAPALSLYSKDAANAVLGQVSGPGRPNSGASGLSVAGGFVVLGRANAATRAICLIGDSISDGTNDTQSPQPTNMGNGWFSRALIGTDGLPLGSSLKATISGDRAQYAASVNTLRRVGLSQCSLAIIALGVNDLAGGQTLAQLLTNVRALAALAKAQGATKVAVCSITPKTAGTFTDAAGQTFTGLTMFDPAGTHLRQDFNTAMAADAAADTNNIDEFINFSSVTDNGATGKWVDNGTLDGTHPVSSMCALMAGPARTVISNVAKTVV
jgi:lysophospholipase L1-like esterase